MRGVGDASRRGIDNALANWPLVLIRIAENVLIILVVLATLFGALLPVFAGGLGLATLGELSENPDAMAEAIAEGILGMSPVLIVYVVALVSLAMLVGVLVHAFVQAGVIGCYVGAERAAPAAAASRRDFRWFTPERWWGEAKRFGWRFFWIYNIVWGAYSLVLLIPILPLFLMLVVFRESPGAIVLTCLGAVLITLFAIVLALVVFVWSQVALIECVATDAGLAEAMRRGRAAFRGRTGTIVLIAIIFFAVSSAVGSVIAGFSIGIDMASAVPGFDIAFLPVRIVLSLLNTAVAALVGAWLLAALVAAVVPRPETPHAAAAGV
ncbi:MAG: hypothetical protein ACRD2J_01270 [Thermoanaerobaculia bacterium]